MTVRCRCADRARCSRRRGAPDKPQAPRAHSSRIIDAVEVAEDMQADEEAAGVLRWRLGELVPQRRFERRRRRSARASLHRIAVAARPKQRQVRGQVARSSSVSVKIGKPLSAPLVTNLPILRLVAVLEDALNLVGSNTRDGKIVRPVRDTPDASRALGEVRILPEFVGDHRLDAGEDRCRRSG
jgi:hypothetical protein